MSVSVPAILRAVCAVLAVASALLAVWWFLYHWDPTRLIWKRWQQDDPYRYEVTDPRFFDVDLEARLHVTSPAAVDRARRRLTALLWENGQLPLAARPSDVATVYRASDWSVLDRLDPDCPSVTTRTYSSSVCLTDMFGGIDNLGRIDLLRIPVSTGYVAIAPHFRPVEGNGRLVVFHQGLAGTYHDQWGHIRTLVGQGYNVIAFNQPGYGDHAGDVPPYEQSEFRMFVEPVVAAIGYALERDRYETVDMLGFSAGAWVTVVTAAVDTRIRRSYAVAGVLPDAMRRTSESAPPQRERRLLDVVSYLDLFVLGAVGEGRGQVHVFNRFDSCCFDGVRGLLYEPLIKAAVSGVGSGRFDVVIDESHPYHKISRRAFAVILDDMQRT